VRPELDAALRDPGEPLDDRRLARRLGAEHDDGVKRVEAAPRGRRQAAAKPARVAEQLLAERDHRPGRSRGKRRHRLRLGRMTAMAPPQKSSDEQDDQPDREQHPLERGESAQDGHHLIENAVGLHRYLAGRSLLACRRARTR
jgi:hypothetical protein